MAQGGCPGSQLEQPPELTGRAGGQDAHREDGGDLVQGRDEDANLADAGSEEQGPRWLSIGFAVTKNLRTQQPSQGPEALGTSCLSPPVLGTNTREAERGMMCFSSFKGTQGDTRFLLYLSHPDVGTQVQGSSDDP